MSARWRRTGLRTRVTLLAGSALALALLAGALLLVATLRAGLTSAVDDRARQALVGVEQLAAEGRLPAVIPAADPSVLVQVLDANGAVIAATPGTSRVVPLLTPAELTGAQREREAVLVDGDRVGYGDGLRVLTGRTTTGAAPNLTVLAAVPVTALDDPLRLVRLALLVGLPLLLLVALAGIWVTVGRTLRPVDALRAGAESISAVEVRQRLAVPQADDEVRRLAETLNGMLDRLEAGGERQRAFVADAAHELRSPLAALQTSLEVARLHPSAQDPAQVVEDAHAGVLRMGRLVEDLLLLARQDASPGGRPGGAVDLAEVARRVVEELAGGPLPVTIANGAVPPADSPRRRPAGSAVPPAGIAARRSARSDARSDAAAPVAVAGRTAARLVRNLVENAQRHARSQVEVTVLVEGGRALLLVDDDGPGVPATDRDRVFERFTRLDSPRSRDAGGAGLGLAIVQAVVRDAGGVVRVEDGPLGGARFRVELPLAQTLAQKNV